MRRLHLPKSVRDAIQLFFRLVALSLSRSLSSNLPPFLPPSFACKWHIRKRIERSRGKKINKTDAFNRIFHTNTFALSTQHDLCATSKCGLRLFDDLLCAQKTILWRKSFPIPNFDKAATATMATITFCKWFFLRKSGTSAFVSWLQIEM